MLCGFSDIEHRPDMSRNTLELCLGLEGAKAGVTGVLEQASRVLVSGGRPLALMIGDTLRAPVIGLLAGNKGGVDDLPERLIEMLQARDSLVRIPIALTEPPIEDGINGFVALVAVDQFSHGYSLV